MLYYSNLSLKNCIEIKGQRGFGDSLCLYPIVRWLRKTNKTVCVYSDHPEVFRPLKCVVRPYEEGVINAGYLSHKKGSRNQFQDICHSLEIPEVPFVIDAPENNLISIATKRRLLCVVVQPYKSFPGILRRHNGLDDQSPDWDVMQRMINLNKNKFCFVGVGSNYRSFNNLDFDFSLQPFTPYDILLDIVSQADIVFCQVGYMMHLAEGLGKMTCVVFSKKSKTSESEFVRTITPQKVLVGKAMAVYDDDWETMYAIFSKCRSCAKVS